MPHHARGRRDAGFTLIELLVVIIVIGILAAIAIPVFLNQRRKAADATLAADLHTAAKAVEIWYADGYQNSDGTEVGYVGSNYIYLSSSGDSTVWPLRSEMKTAGFPSIALSPGSGIGVRVGNTNGGYCIVGSHKTSSYRYGAPGVGSDPAALLYYDSLTGGVRTRAQLTAAGACHFFRIP